MQPGVLPRPHVRSIAPASKFGTDPPVFAKMAPPVDPSVAPKAPNAATTHVATASVMARNSAARHPVSSVMRRPPAVPKKRSAAAHWVASFRARSNAAPTPTALSGRTVRRTTSVPVWTAGSIAAIGCIQGNCCGTEDCDESGTCIENSCCYPECDGIYCGDDGCGGTCGCPEGADCLNGGCFTACEDFGECPPNDCNLCLCRPQQADGWLCMNTGSDVGNDCATTADCPAGSICSGFYSGDPDLPYICISPCCG